MSSRVEPVSQIDLQLHSSGEHSAFEIARSEIIEFAKKRAGGPLPEEALEGRSFLTDEIGTRRIEGIAIDSRDYWGLRFDDEDKEVARRKWVIEAALAGQGDDEPALFEVRLQCIARGENPSYDRSVPAFVRDVIKACDARLDGRRQTLAPWIVDTADEVDQLIELLTLPSRQSDVVVVSLPESSNDPSHELISSKSLARDLAGAAHVVTLTGQGSLYLSDQVGRELSVFQQAIRTYRPGFDTNAEAQVAHPFSLAHRIIAWDGGRDAFRLFITSETLRRTVKGVDSKRTPRSFAEAKRDDAEIRRHNARQAGSSNKKLLELAEEEIERYRQDAESQKQLSDDLLREAEGERDRAEAKIQRLQNTLFHVRRRVQSLEAASAEPSAADIPDNLDELGEWAEGHLAGTVELHSRALRGAKNSEYEDVSLIYDALLLLRDYYVPMRREGGLDRRQAFSEQCEKLGIEEERSVSGGRAGEQGDTYFVRWESRRVELDRHLRKGTNREARYCFRLYFFWDEPTTQVVVGWLPSHLSTRAS